MQGARDVAVPIAFSILTNVVAFMPLMFVPGIMGKVWQVIPLVVITVFLISWVESLLILPTHLAHSDLRPRQQPAPLAEPEAAGFWPKIQLVCRYHLRLSPPQDAVSTGIRYRRPARHRPADNLRLCFQRQNELYPHAAGGI